MPSLIRPQKNNEFSSNLFVMANLFASLYVSDLSYSPYDSHCLLKPLLLFILKLLFDWLKLWHILFTWNWWFLISNPTFFLYSVVFITMPWFAGTPFRPWSGGTSILTFYVATKNKYRGWFHYVIHVNFVFFLKTVYSNNLTNNYLSLLWSWGSSTQKDISTGWLEKESTQETFRVLIPPPQLPCCNWSVPGALSKKTLHLFHSEATNIYLE